MLLPILLINEKRVKAQGGDWWYSQAIQKIDAKKKTNKTFLPDKNHMSKKKITDAVTVSARFIRMFGKVITKPSAISFSTAVSHICRFLSKCQKR